MRVLKMINGFEKLFSATCVQLFIDEHAETRANLLSDRLNAAAVALLFSTSDGFGADLHLKLLKTPQKRSEQKANKAPLMVY